MKKLVAALMLLNSINAHAELSGIPQKEDVKITGYAEKINAVCRVGKHCNLAPHFFTRIETPYNFRIYTVGYEVCIEKMCGKMTEPFITRNGVNLHSTTYRLDPILTKRGVYKVTTRVLLGEGNVKEEGIITVN